MLSLSGQLGDVIKWQCIMLYKNFKKLKCIKTINATQYTALTIGKIYELDSIGEKELLHDAYVGSYSSYYIKDDDGEYRYFSKECFIDIEEWRDNRLNQLGIK